MRTTGHWQEMSFWKRVSLNFEAFKIAILYIRDGGEPESAGEDFVTSIVAATKPKISTARLLAAAWLGFINCRVPTYVKLYSRKKMSREDAVRFSKNSEAFITRTFTPSRKNVIRIFQSSWQGASNTTRWGIVMHELAHCRTQGHGIEFLVELYKIAWFTHQVIKQGVSK